jgi:hypothetical protein
MYKMELCKKYATSRAEKLSREGTGRARPYTQIKSKRAKQCDVVTGEFVGYLTMY